MRIVQRVKDKQITFRIENEKAREFKAYCAFEGTKIQAVLENAIDEFLERAKKKTPNS